MMQISRKDFIRVAMGALGTGALYDLGQRTYKKHKERQRYLQSLDYFKQAALETTDQFDQLTKIYDELPKLRRSVGLTISENKNKAGAGSCVLVDRHILLHSFHQLYNKELMVRFSPEQGKQITLAASVHAGNEEMDTAVSLLDEKAAQEAEKAGVEPVTLSQFGPDDIAFQGVLTLGFARQPKLHAVESAVTRYYPHLNAYKNLKMEEVKQWSCKIGILDHLGEAHPLDNGMSGGLVAYKGVMVGICNSGIWTKGGQVSLQEGRITPIGPIRYGLAPLFPESRLATGLPPRPANHPECYPVFVPYVV